MEALTASAARGAASERKPGLEAGSTSDPRERADAALEPYREDYEQVAADLGPESLRELRQRAFESFLERGFPSLREEEWRHTNVAPVARAGYRPAPEVEISRGDLDGLLLDGCRHVVLVNGRLAPKLSELDGEIRAASLPAELEENGEVASAFGRSFAGARHPFVALNTALFRDGVVIDIPAKKIIEEPVQVLNVAVADSSRPRVSYPRALILAGEQSQGTIVETYATLGDGQVFSCPVTEIVASEASVLRHYRHVRESMASHHLAAQRVDAARAANLSSLSLVAGGGLLRNDIHAAIDGEGVECVLNGLYVLADRQLADHHMRVEHIQPNSHSHELFKGVLDDRSRAVFNGRIYVHKPAQKTDAVQTNRNLLLSDQALVNSNPQLEIFADDVKCTHGSTIGQLDEDAIFYLRSRGVESAAARSLLIFAFASELVETITVPSLKTEIEEFLYRRLPGGDLVRRVG